MPSPRSGPEQVRFRLFEAVANLLKSFARLEALLIILDDLHDADRASLMMLRFAARELRGARIVMVGTYRDVEVRCSPALSKLIGDLNREARPIPLAGLSRAEVAELVEVRSGRTPAETLVSRLYAATDGNPLFVDGIVRILIADGEEGAHPKGDQPFRIPDGVRDAIRHRIAALSRSTASVLSVAAAIGNEFDADSCRRVAALSSKTTQRLLDEASRAGIVIALWHARYRFSHALIREAVYDEIKPDRRVRLHRKIGGVMEATYRTSLQPHLAELAHHFSEAGLAEKSIDYSIRAAEAAEAVFAYEEAAQFYKAAVDASQLSGPDNPARKLELLLALAIAQFYAGSFPSSQDAFARAVEIARSLNAGRSFARAVVGLAGQPQDALTRAPNSKIFALVEEALAMYHEQDGLRSMLLARLAIDVHLRGDDSGRAESLFESAIDVARRIGDRNALFNALNSRACFRILGPSDADLMELATIAREAVDPDAVWLGFLFNYRRHLAAGDIEAVDAGIEVFARATGQTRLPGARSALSGVRGTRALMNGELGEAERFFEETMRILDAWGRFDPGQMFPLILGLRREQDRLDEIVGLAHRGVELFPSYRFARVSLAQVLLGTGREADARSEFERLAINDFGDVPLDTNWLATVTLLADLCAHLRDAQRARILYQLLLPYAEHNAHFLVLACYGPVSHYLGMLATVMSRYTEGEIHFQSALEFNLRMKARLFVAYAQRDYSAMLRARNAPGDRPKAQELLNELANSADPRAQAARGGIESRGERRHLVRHR